MGEKDQKELRGHLALIDLNLRYIKDLQLPNLTDEQRKRFHFCEESRIKCESSRREYYSELKQIEASTKANRIPQAHMEAVRKNRERYMESIRKYDIELKKIDTEIRELQTLNYTPEQRDKLEYIHELKRNLEQWKKQSKFIPAIDDPFSSSPSSSSCSSSIPISQDIEVDVEVEAHAKTTRGKIEEKEKTDLNVNEMKVELRELFGRTRYSTLTEALALSNRKKEKEREGTIATTTTTTTSEEETKTGANGLENEIKNKR